jgi:uncharacterized protein YkvS
VTKKIDNIVLGCNNAVAFYCTSAVEFLLGSRRVTSVVVTLSNNTGDFQMNRTIVSILAVFLFLSGASQAHAQIKIDKKPAPAVGPDEVVVYTWTSSWGLRDDPPNKYPLGVATHKTEAEAVAAAKAHMARSAGNGNLAVTHYLIEGEPSVRNKMADRAEKAKELLDRVEEAKKAVDEAKKVAKGEEPLLKSSEPKLGDTIKEYKAMVEKSLGQVTEAKKTLTGGVASLTNAKFREVNGLIDQYNRQVQDFQSVMGKDGDLGFKTLERVQPPKPEKDEIAGKWSTGTNDWEFGADGSFQITGTRNRGEWKKTANGIVVKYSGASVWIDLTFVGDALVDQKGYIGKAQLKKQR